MHRDSLFDAPIKSGSLGYEKNGEVLVTKKQLDELEAERDRLRKRFGKNFKEPYGWAEKALDKAGKVNKPGKQFKANFADLEKIVGLNFYRPHFAFSSYNIHADSVVEEAQLGMPSLAISQDTERVLSGPSGYGLRIPMDLTATSLSSLTSAKLLTVPSQQWAAITHLMFLLSDEISEACRKVEKDIATFYHHVTYR